MRKLKSKDKKRKKRKRATNKEYTIVSYFFVLIFLSLAGYMVYFNVAEKDDVINSPYNTRQNQFQERILRGSICKGKKRHGICSEFFPDDFS